MKNDNNVWFCVVYSTNFSRKILLLDLSPTNHNHCDTHWMVGCIHVGIPQYLRSKHGTENCFVASLHIAFRIKNKSPLHKHFYIYGPSKSNVVGYTHVLAISVSIISITENWVMMSLLRQLKTS